MRLLIVISLVMLSGCGAWSLVAVDSSGDEVAGQLVPGITLEPIEVVARSGSGEIGCESTPMLYLREDGAVVTEGGSVVQGYMYEDDLLDMSKAASDLVIPPDYVEPARPTTLVEFEGDLVLGADSESLTCGGYSGFSVVDSTGELVHLRTVLEQDSSGDEGAAWRFVVSEDGGLDEEVDARAELGSGVIYFDEQGDCEGVAGARVRIGDGDVEFDFSRVTSGRGDQCFVVMSRQDGYPAGRVVWCEADSERNLVVALETGMSRAFGRLADASCR